MTDAASCKICLAQPESVERIVYEDHLWRLRHSSETNISAYLVLESRRHFLDLSQANDDECRTFGIVMSNAISAIRAVTDCSRVYSFILAEMVPHFHIHLIPRTNFLPPAYRGRGIMSYPTTPVADANVVELVCERLRRAMKSATHAASIADR